MLAAAAVLIGFGWWMARNPQEVRGGDAYLWTWGAVFLFVAAVPAVARELLRRGPLLVLSHAGLEDRRTSYGLIPWSAIEGAELMEMNRQKFLMLRMRDPSAWKTKQSAFARWSQPLNEAFGFRGLPIDVTGLTMRPEDVVAEVRRRLQARVER